MAITGIIFGIAYLVPDISAFFNLLGANLGSCI